jgi:RNA polymerase sigma-70 factor (ECF subfamily)
VDTQAHRAEFAELVHLCQGRLFGYIHSLVRDLDDADDLFQQTTLTLWKKFDEFQRERSFFAWACGVARFEVANFLRARGRDRLYFSDELNLLLVEAHAELAEDELEDRREALSGCIDKLRERDRQLLEECYTDPAGVNGVAGRMGRVPQSVHNSLRRIRQALYQCIQRTLAREDSPGWIG